MSDANGSNTATRRECVTHHNACDCREAARDAEVRALRCDLANMTQGRDNWHDACKQDRAVMGLLDAENKRLRRLVKQGRDYAATCADLMDDVDPDDIENAHEFMTEADAALKEPGA